MPRHAHTRNACKGSVSERVERGSNSVEVKGCVRRVCGGGWKVGGAIPVNECV